MLLHRSNWITSGCTDVCSSMKRSKYPRYTLYNEKILLCNTNLPINFILRAYNLLQCFVINVPDGRNKHILRNQTVETRANAVCKLNFTPLIDAACAKPQRCMYLSSTCCCFLVAE